MTIQSLGVGSGLALDDLVQQLLTAERQPKEERLNAKEERIEAEISGLGQIKSKLSDFKDAVDELRSDNGINGREPTITNPSEDNDVLSAEASNSALRGSYEVVVEQLAAGSRITTDAGAFTSSSDPVLTSGTGSLTFDVGGSKSFTIDVTAGMSLTALREKINNSDDNFGVTANIIDTGTGAGPRLVFSSSETGDGNDLVITNDTGAAELDRLSTTGGTNNISAANIESAKNAIAYIDGIEVQSSSNEFENTIQNVSFEVNEVSPKDAAGDFLATKLSIGYDKEGLDKKIRDFVDNYNALIDEIKTLTRYGESELEEDGALAGDSLLRGIQSGLASIVGDNVSSSALGGLFQIGIEFDDDGKLEIGSTDFGLGTGEDRLEDALEDSFDEIAKLFTDPDEGIATRLYEFSKEYTSYSGLISLRERAAKDDREDLYDQRETLELRMLNYEEILRDKYLNLDQTVAQLNQTGSALLASL
ncbi:flagellar filament capping protein FliD [Alteromonas macleodii]|uniref:Flagellar hook-associated protein 2 n=1 Tax=Alteromonas macleodii TaxID=28108 RepID=A0AB36G0M2_ALTMA|nr:flagellar filament capping protein FliD [Alteromonas macleodii]MEC8376812.1 flagellar filament capping protein FliD [Pseudomonadota bacterium]KHT58539.1 flagellar hook protein [Alteromonas macleodii]OES33298.1 flagellar hook-associated family protein [Alteromonas macleodii]OES34781.1 flagellar hook-associated family protein [Alteromonas macleodii]OES36823.1 flagellar hook-associated family protein [Alteromonas macleodii]|tara:strand:+ start:2005 stop:3435 length:1431 start_codon:yes stop_codon:yes gene_type:complete